MEAAAAQPLMPQPQPQLQLQPQLQPQPPAEPADVQADAHAYLMVQCAKTQQAQAEYERLKNEFAEAQMAADVAKQEAQQIRGQCEQAQQQQAQQQVQVQQQQQAAELRSPCDRPQQPSSLPVVDLCVDSIKEVKIAPAQAASMHASPSAPKADSAAQNTSLNAVATADPVSLRPNLPISTLPTPPMPAHLELSPIHPCTSFPQI